MTIKVGTSGFGIAQSKYVQLFSCVEVQHTFYQPPQISTLERWRAAAPPNFEFVLKAWQLITHDRKSPTYRRLKKNLSDVEQQEAGYFRPTEVVQAAWETTLACAQAVQARTILFQCPASFKQTKENIANLKRFFKCINAYELNLAWEPRGEWDPKVVRRICDELNLWHAVDPFTAESTTPDKVYFRLHGRNGWRYEYEENELCELAAKLDKAEPRAAAIRLTDNISPYVFFNNALMTKDALRFQSILNGC